MKTELSREKVVEALKKVKDPELNLDIWTLGLVYDIKIIEKQLKIVMTFTTIFCPYGPALVADVKNELNKIAGTKKVDVVVVFEPPWKPSEELRAMLGV